MKRNVPKEIKSIARERIGRVKGTRVIVPKTKRDLKYRERSLKCDAVENGAVCFCPVNGPCVYE